MYNNVGLEMPRILWQGRLIKFSTLPECFFTTSKPHLNLEGSLNILYINIITHRPQPGVERRGREALLPPTSLTPRQQLSLGSFEFLGSRETRGDSSWLYPFSRWLADPVSSLPLWAGAAVLRVGRRALATCTRGLKGELLRP